MEDETGKRSQELRKLKHSNRLPCFHVRPANNTNHPRPQPADFSGDFSVLFVSVAVDIILQGGCVKLGRPVLGIQTLWAGRGLEAGSVMLTQDWYEKRSHASASQKYQLRQCGACKLFEVKHERQGPGESICKTRNQNRSSRSFSVQRRKHHLTRTLIPTIGARE